MRILLPLFLSLLLVACAAPAPRQTDPLSAESGQAELLQRRIATLEQGMVALQRQLDEQATLLSNLDRQLANLPSQSVPANQPGTTTTAEPAPRQKLPDEQNRQAARDYLTAFTDLTTGRYPEAASGFERFLETYPENQYAGNALFWLGEAQVAQRQLATAADTFRQVYERYPQAGKAPEALLKLATLRRQLGQDEQAMQALSLLQTNYPDSPAAKRAGTIFN